MPNCTICTTDRNGSECTFQVEYRYESNRHGDTWYYSINSRDEPHEFFEVRFKTLDEGRIRIAVIDRHELEEFKAKGIPEAIFEHVVSICGCTLVSSVREGNSRSGREFEPDSVEERTVDAEKMWRRLVAAKRARYDGTEDRYIFVPCSTAGQ